MNCELFSLYVFVHFQHVLLVRILIFHLIHGFLDHEDAQAADGPFLRGEGNVRVFLGQGVIGNAAVDEGDHHGPGFFLQVHADGDGAGVRGVGIAGDVDKNLFCWRFATLASRVSSFTLILRSVCGICSDRIPNGQIIFFSLKILYRISLYDSSRK